MSFQIIQIMKVQKIEAISENSTDEGCGIYCTVMTPRLNLPSYNVRFKTEGKRTLILDTVRKKYVAQL